MTKEAHEIVRSINEAILAGKTVTAPLAYGVDGLLVAARIGYCDLDKTAIGIFRGEHSRTFFKPDYPPGVSAGVMPKRCDLFHVFEFPVKKVTIYEVPEVLSPSPTVKEIIDSFEEDCDEYQLLCTCGRNCPIHRTPIDSEDSGAPLE